MLVNGDWMDAVVCFLTNGGDPTMQVLAPTAVYGSILLGMFIFSSSAVIPIVVSIILAGVIFAAFPANAVTVIVIMILFGLAAGGQALSWRMGT
jgi:hypothetical protein